MSAVDLFDDIALVPERRAHGQARRSSNTAASTAAEI